MNSPKPNTLWNRWQENAEKFPDRSAIIHWVAGEEPIRISFKELIETAKKFSIMIHKSGIKKGDVCAIIIKHNPLFYPLYLGIIRTGVLPSILAYPNPRLHPDKFRQGLEGMAQRSGLDYMLIQSDLESLVKPLVEKPGSTIKSIFHPLEWNLDAEYDPKIDEEIENISQTINENDALLLQHSSGTTGLQKPVVLSHAAVLKHVKNFGKALKFNEKDIISTWLPLYHDMGLIGAFHLPLAYGIPSIQIDPFEWVLAPIIHLESISKERATVGFLPNFAYNIYAEKIHDEELAELDLSSLRLLVNASEPIRHDSHQKFADKMEKYGFNPLALTGMYGMAEMTLSVIQTEPGTKIKEVTVDRNKLSNGIVELATENSVPRVCVSSGKLIDGCQIKIVDDNRNLIPKNLVGEIAVKSVSQFDGYRNYPEKTAEVVDQDGWYYSGDYGFEYEGEYFIIGRKKDIIIVAGKNIYPEDIEDAVNQVNGVIPGRVIAFGEDDAAMGTEFVSVVAETKYETDEQKNELRIAILRAGMSIDVVIHKVYIVPSRWLIKSSSGKPSRKANKERLTEENDPQVWSK